MSIKNELKEYAQEHYDPVKEEIIESIKDSIKGGESNTKVYWVSLGYDKTVPSFSLIDKVMNEIDLPYEHIFDNDSLGVSIDISELYEMGE